ncbi:MAG: methylated-DNA--[protein]-cysteine S-methyltransferase [Tumebacillaceae bacterium]
MNTYRACYNSPIGRIEIQANEQGITSALFVEEEPTLPERENLHIREAVKQLDEYFSGDRRTFTVPLHLEGSPFQRGVWTQLQSIPYGRTVSYSDLAAAIGNSRAVRAVGTANGKNRIALLIPCHRVIGKNQELAGYAWGTWRKEWLLEHEKQKRGIEA